MFRQYLRIFRWHVLRYLARHPLLATLNAGTVALGVALYLAIQVTNYSANRAFEASVDLVAGKAQLEVNSPGGDLPDILFPRIAAQPGVAAATPIVEGFVSLPQFPGEYLDLLGIDVFTNEPFRTFQLSDFSSGETFDLQGWLRAPRTIALSEEFAREHHLREGDSLTIQLNGRTQSLTVGFLFRSEGEIANADPHFAVMDIGWAQEFLGRSGSLDSVSLRLTNGASPEIVADELKKFLPPGVTVAAPARRSAEVEKMLSGFQLNLAAMSLVSLLVGMFLIYNTIEASVVRRRTEIGILRSLGATRHEIRALFLAEAAALGLVGIIIGMAGGYLLARALLGAVIETISSLYVLLSVSHLAVAPWIWVSAFFLGAASVLVAAWVPAQGAAMSDPVEALHHGARMERSIQLSRGWLLAGFATLVCAGFLSFLALEGGPRWISFGAAFCVLAGFSLLVPESISRFSRAWKWRGAERRLAAQNLGRALLRNSITIAALAAAVAMTVGVAVMVFSFRETVSDWINQTLVADLFIGPASNEVAGPTSFMPPEAIRFLEKNPAVEAVDTFRHFEVRFGDETISLAVVRGSNRRNLRFLRGPSDSIMRRFYREQCVLISESFSRHHRLSQGDVLRLPTPSGIQKFPIAGIYYDYTSDQGTVLLSEKNFLQWWKDGRINSVGVFLRKGASAKNLAEEFRRRFSHRGEFSIYSNQSLRARIFEVFDQTFAVTYVLRSIAVIVAVAGIFLGLTTLVTERSRELGVLRAIGASAGQIRRLLLWESGMIGLLASVLGIASGLCLALVLTGVINRAYFGWTIRLAFPWLSLAWTPLWIIAAALLAGWIPAWRAGRLNVAEAVRSE
jgi:putative ABC transport system permease protein